MNFRQLQAFQEVMRTGSVTKAAQNLGRTQPAISSLIVGLEQSVGYNLFDRQGGRLHPVPEAHYLLSETDVVLERLTNLERTMKDIGSQASGHLTIACMPIYSETLMPGAISRFAESRKDVTFSLTSQSSEQVYERVASQQFDLGLAEASISNPLVEEEIVSMRCFCAVNAASELSNRSLIRLSDLKDYDIATFLPHHFIRRHLTQVYEYAGLELKVKFEMQHAAAQMVAVEHNLAVALVSAMSAENYRRTVPNKGRLKFIPFEHDVAYNVAILTPTHKAKSQLIRAFVEHLKEEVIHAVGTSF